MVHCPLALRLYCSLGQTRYIRYCQWRRSVLKVVYAKFASPPRPLALPSPSLASP